MKKSLFFVLSLLTTAVQAQSAVLTVTYTNTSGDALTALTALPKGAANVAAVNLLATPIPSGGSAGVSFDSGDEGQCVFDLNFAFASGKTLDRPDLDLCQTDGIMVE